MIALVALRGLAAQAALPLELARVVLAPASEVPPPDAGAPVAEVETTARGAESPFPDTGTLALMREQAGGRRIVVWCGEARYEFAGAQFDSSGVWSTKEGTYRPLRRAFVQTASVGRERVPPLPIAWSAVDSIALVRTDWKHGAKVGVTVGILIGIVLAPTSYWFAAAVAETGGTPLAISVGVTAVAACALIGTALASPVVPRERVYPSR